ncbi:MAG: STAS domain-containing protein [Proteobacteria bacterium]|nr:STAS domain-containing protein [Pseudomonadota bacterium]
MTKRKKAKSARPRPTRGGHLLGPPREAGAARNSTADASPSPVSTTLVLAAECLVAGAGALKESLAPLVEQPLPVTLDITDLQRIDTAGLQVLTAFARERTGHGRAIEWRGTAPALTSAAQLLGLTAALGLPA